VVDVHNNFIAEDKNAAALSVAVTAVVMINTLEESTLRKQLANGRRLAHVMRDPFDAESYLEWQLDVVSASQPRPRQKLQFGLPDGEANVRREDAIAVAWRRQQHQEALAQVKIDLNIPLGDSKPGAKGLANCIAREMGPRIIAHLDGYHSTSVIVVFSGHHLRRVCCAGFIEVSSPGRQTWLGPVLHGRTMRRRGCGGGGVYGDGGGGVLASGTAMASAVARGKAEDALRGDHGSRLLGGPAQGNGSNVPWPSL
jgi:hypothetical protein